MSPAAGGHGFAVPHGADYTGAVFAERVMPALLALTTTADVPVKARAHRFAVTTESIGYEPGEWFNPGEPPFGGEVTYGGKDEWGFSVDAGGGANQPGARTVAALSLDTIFKQNTLTDVDYLKMDIEGAEGTVLEGELLWLKGVRAIKIEAHPPVATVEQCRAVLERHGFACTIDAAHWSCVVGVRPN
jgi:hypothetical protein